MLSDGHFPENIWKDYMIGMQIVSKLYWQSNGITTLITAYSNNENVLNIN